ncbi:MAG: hypothetical protein QOD41_2334, partial [Cryptosporangiaceae bacterium]|nr:hypothetical protein [Cryptosporangiaceae bacterium]
MHPRFVGRQHELTGLAAQLAEAAAGRGSAVIVTGEPGIGKTAVVEQAAARSSGPVLTGRAVADDGAPAFWPWIRLLAL